MNSRAIKALTRGKARGTTIIYGVLALLLLAFGLQSLKGVKKIFEGLGLSDSKEDKMINNTIEAVTVNSPWHAAFWKMVTAGVKPMYYADADQIVKDVWESFGAFNDNEEQAIGAMKKLKTQAQVSFVVERFYTLHKVDLLPWLQGGNYPQDRLSNDELAIIVNYVNKLPKK
jgi:hypothetical protein